MKANFFPAKCVLPVLFAISFLLASSPSLARFGDGSLVLSWSNAETLSNGISSLVAGTEIDRSQGFEFVLVGTEEERFAPTSDNSPLRLENLQAGNWRLELRTYLGAPVKSWTILVRSEIATPVHIDLNRGTMDIAPYSPEPFGNWEVWDERELEILPGQGEAALVGVDTRETRNASSRLDGMNLADPALPRPRPMSLDQGLVGAQKPLGTVPAAFAAPSRWLHSRDVADSRIDLGGSAGTSGRYLGQGWLSGRAPHQTFGWLSIYGQLQYAQFENPGPSGVLSSLDHNELELIETYATASVSKLGPGEGHLRFYAFGNSRDYYLHEFRNNLSHSPREDRAHLDASASYDVPLASGVLSFEGQFVRSYFESGDGQDFDVLSAYATSANNAEVTADGLYWAGDASETAADEGKHYDYYRRTLGTEWNGRVDAKLSVLPMGKSRIGAELTLGKWRVYEHLAPSQTVTSGDAGFQNVRRFGYSRNGESREDEVGNEAREPGRLALYASQRFALGKAQAEAGVRWSQFDSGQRGLRDLADPFGGDEVLGDEDLLAEESHSTLAPRVGLYLPFSEKTHVWLDGGRRQIVPPYEAVYFDPNLLRLHAGLAETSIDRFGRDFIFGNPSITPEDEWSGHLGLFRQHAQNLSIQLAAYGSRTQDTWIVRSVPLGVDRLLHFDNEGERRSFGLHTGIRWETSETAQLRLQYDLARTQTNVVEPYALYEHLRAEGQPIQNVAARQTSLGASLGVHDGATRDFFPSILDRTHRFSATWTTEISRSTLGLGDDITETGQFAAVFRAASGLPYSPTFVRKEGSIEQSLETATLVSPNDLNSERLPWNWQLDVAYGQPFRIFDRELFGRIEVRNLTNRRNVQRVYAATGEANDDGWLDSPEGQSDVDRKGASFENTYRDRLEDPRNYTDGIHARVAITVGL